jgi:hypothetical protein
LIRDNKVVDCKIIIQEKGKIVIEFQYFEGCPNAKNSLDNLIVVKKELKLEDNEIRIIEVPDLESAEKYNFQGSPSILINGIDIYTDSKPLGYNYSCRVYSFNGQQTGIIPREFIKEKILQLRQG